jgi:hypothetical protein
VLAEVIVGLLACATVVVTARGGTAARKSVIRTVTVSARHATVFDHDRCNSGCAHGWLVGEVSGKSDRC